MAHPAHPGTTGLLVSALTNLPLILGGKMSGLPSGLPTQYYHGYIGCLRNVKVFRRKLDLLRNGHNSNVELCEN